MNIVISERDLWTYEIAMESDEQGQNEKETVVEETEVGLEKLVEELTIEHS